MILKPGVRDKTDIANRTVVHPCWIGKRTAPTFDTGLATPRILVSFIENHQQADGSVRIPKALQAYMGGKEFIGKK